MYKIIVDNVSSRIVPEMDHESLAWKVARRMTSYKKPDWWRTDRGRAGLWDGWKRMLSAVRQVFPTGFLHRIEKYWTEYGIPYEIEDVRLDPCEEIQDWDLLPFEDGSPWVHRPYQDDAIAIGLLRKRGIFHIGTGGGKTPIAAGLWRGAGCPRGAVFVHTKVLLNQHLEFLGDRLGVPIGQIGEGLWKPERLTVVLVHSVFPPKRGSEETRIKRKKVEKWVKVKAYLRELEWFFSDECHLIGNNLWYRVLMECCNAYYRFAGSGTPFGRSSVERHLLVASTGQRIVHIPYKQLKEEGWVCPTSLYVVPLQWKNPQNEYKDFQLAYSDLIVNDVARHRLIVDIFKKFGSGRKTLILVRILAHGEHLEAILKDAGVKTQFISGSSGKKVRASTLKDFMNGNLKVLVASGILDQGLDLPDLSLIINAAGGKAETRALQKIGRGVRNAPNKEQLIYVDIFDYDNKYLRNHSLERLRVYHEEGGYDIKVLERDEL